PEVFDLGEEKVNVSFFHNGNKNSLVGIQGLPDERTSINLTALADVTGNTPRADILVKMQNLIQDFHTLLLYVSSRLSISESQNISSELLFLDSSLCFCQTFNPIWILAASIVFSSRHATVIGPTPPGTGVI